MKATGVHEAHTRGVVHHTGNTSYNTRTEHLFGWSRVRLGDFMTRIRVHMRHWDTGACPNKL